MLLDVDAGEEVFLDEALADDDGVLVVAAFPAHERHQDVPAEGQLAVVGGTGVGDRIALLQAHPHVHDGALVDARPLVGADVLLKQVLVQLAGIGLDLDAVGGDAGDDAGAPGDHDLTRVQGGAPLHAGADDRRLRLQERHGLALHVRAHQGAVGVVVLEERDEGRGDRDDLLGRDVHVLDGVGPRLGELVSVAARDPVAHEVAFRVELGVGLGDVVLFLFVRGQVLDLRGHHRSDLERLRLLALQLGDRGFVELLAGLADDFAVLAHDVHAGEVAADVGVVPGDRPLDLAVGRLDEAVAVDAAEGGQRSDQSDVRAFRRLDRADATVVAVVDVANVEAGALAREPAGAQRGEASLARQFGQRVGLVHELAELAAAEELLHRRHHGPDVDEGVRGRLVDFLDRHALADDALHAEQADPEGVLDQLAVGADAAVAQVVDVVRSAEAAVQLDQVADDRRDVLTGDDPLLAVQLGPHPLGHRGELLVELVAADATEVVAAEVEEEALDQLAGVVAGRRVARAQLLVDLDQGVLLGLRQVLVQRRGDVLVLRVAVDGREDGADLVVVLVADGSQERRRGDLALAVDLDRQEVLVARLELEPGAAIRDHLGREERPAARRILEGAVVDARRAHELADDDALGAVDDERPLVRHEREVAHVDPLALDLAGLLDQEFDVHVERPAEGKVLGPALQFGVLGRTELVVQEMELHHLAGEVLDRADLVEQLAQPFFHEPVERAEL